MVGNGKEKWRADKGPLVLEWIDGHAINLHILVG